MEKNGAYYTLITGASSGIGKAMAEEFARHNKSLVLISLPGTALQEQCENLASKYHVKCRYLEIDLREHEAPSMIHDFVLHENLQINILVNNIGIGHEGNIGDLPSKDIDEMIILNMCTTTHLTNLFLNELKSYPESYILNMGSFGGFLPAPHKSIYLATKAYVYYFSCGLSHELKNTSVKVSVAMPGPVASNRKIIERIQKNGRAAGLMKLNPEKVAKCIVPRLLSGERVIIPGWMTRTVYLLGLVLPYGAVLHLAKNLFTSKN